MSFLVLVTGGAASGKSEQAERILCERVQGPKLYVATMEPYNEEAQKRIGRHRKLREGKGFETAECYTGLADLDIQKGYSGILLEDVGNLLANEMFTAKRSVDEAVLAVLTGVRNLRKHCRGLVIVTNEVFSDGADYGQETLNYIKALGRINIVIAGKASEAYESVAGILAGMGNKGWAG